MPSPTCTIQDGASAPVATTDGVDVLDNGGVVTIQLVDLSAETWTPTITGTDDLVVKPTLTINATTKTATFTKPAGPWALIFQSQVDGGVDVNGDKQQTYTTTFGVYCKDAAGNRLMAGNERAEGSASFGWITKINRMISTGGIGIPGAITLESYGAKGDGVTSDATAYKNALASGKIIVIGGKTYLVNGYTGGLDTANQSLTGFGNDSEIKDTANESAIVVGADNVTIQDLQIVGNAADASNHGVAAAGFSHTRVSGVYVSSTGGNGIYYTTGAYSTGPQLSNIRVVSASGYALKLDGTEYATITNLQGDSCGGGGVYIDGGNNILAASSLTASGTALYINSVTDSTNDGHMIIIGNNLNHSTVESVHVEPLAKGLGIDHCHIYGFAAPIYVKGNSVAGKKSLVRFRDNEIAVNNINLDGTIAEFDGNLFTADGTATNTFNWSANGNASTAIVRPNNMQLDGTPFDLGVDCQWDIANGRALNLKWSGVTRSSWEGTHGRFTAGGSGTDTLAVMGPLVSAEATFAAVWLLANGTAPSSTNYGIAGNGTNFIFNAPSGEIAFNTPIVDMRDAGGLDSVLFSLASSGANSMLSSSTATALTVGTNKTGATTNISANADVTYLSLGGANGTGLGGQSVTPTVATTGNTTLTAAQAAFPVIRLGTISLTGNITITFPNAVGGPWFVDCSGVTLNGHTIQFVSGTTTSAAFTPSTTNGFAIVMTFGANAITFK